MPADAPIRILLVDDHSLFRRGLRALLDEHADLQVAGEADDAGEALRLAQELAPDLILLDNHLPGVHGVDAIDELRRRAPRARVVMLTVSESVDDLRQALRAGASGYLLKNCRADELVGALRRAMHGETVIGAGLAAKVMQAFDAPAVAAPGAAATAPAPASALAPAPSDAKPGAAAADGVGALSSREREIARAIARGASNKHIARELGLAEATVKAHVRVILRKLGLASRVQVAVLASRLEVDRLPD
jgi:two-component system nitrate/nitrite response regulator NarL